MPEVIAARPGATDSGASARYFLATGTVTQPGQIGPHLAEEARVRGELRQQGLMTFDYTELTELTEL